MKILKPLNSFVYFKIPKEKKTTASGIILAPAVDRHKTKDEGIVIDDATATLREGDVIFVDKYTSSQIDEDEDFDYYVIDFSSIYGVKE